MPKPTEFGATASPPPLSVFSQELLSATQEVRAREGLPALVPSASLTRAAESYAAVLAEYEWFDHTGPDGSTLATRAGSAGYSATWLGEVLYMGPTSGSPTEVVTTWLDSPGHRSILFEGQFTEIGVGCAVSGDIRWCVEDFGGPL